MTHMCPAHGDGLSGRNDSVGIGLLYRISLHHPCEIPPDSATVENREPARGTDSRRSRLPHPIFFKKLASFHNLALHGTELSLADAYGPCAQIHEADPWHADCPASLQVTPN